MDRHAGILEQGVESLAVERRRQAQPQRIGENQHHREEEEAVDEQGRYGVGGQVGMALAVDADDQGRKEAEQQLPKQEAPIERAPECRKLIDGRLRQARDGGHVVHAEVACEKREPQGEAREHHEYPHGHRGGVPAGDEPGPSRPGPPEARHRSVDGAQGRQEEGEATDFGHRWVVPSLGCCDRTPRGSIGSCPRAVCIPQRAWPGWSRP